MFIEHKIRNYYVSEMREELVIRVGRKRTIVIPKRVAERLGIDEGDYLLLTIHNDKIEVKPMPNAITLSLRGRKIAKITLRELEEESMRVQKEYIEKT